MKTLKTLKGKTLKTTKTLKTIKRITGPTRVKAPVRIKAAQKTVCLKTITSKEEIETLADIHLKNRYIDGKELKGERIVKIERDRAKENDLKTLFAHMGNFSPIDTLWHYGNSYYNQESREESETRMRLYYEAIASHPTPEYWEELGYEPTYFDGWMFGFMIGCAYGKDNINEEAIKKWEQNRKSQLKKRAEELRGQPFPDDDIPF